MQKTILGLLCLAPLALLALPRPQARENRTIQNPKSKIQNGVQNDALIQADNAFGLKLLQTLKKQVNSENFLISPVSLAVALQMTYNGADGETATGMAQALQIPGMSLDALNQGNAALLKSLSGADQPNQKGVELHVANSLWTRASMMPLPDFIQRNQSYYGAKFGDLSGGADAVNGWVKQQTSGKIPTIVTPDDVRNTDAILANAVYFKGAWGHAFQTRNTKMERFTTLYGRSHDVSMMRQSGRFPYYENDKYQAVSLPYGNGPTVMTILLPRGGVRLSAFVAGLTVQDFAPKAEVRSGDIGLPRFKTEYSAEMSLPLSALGMATAFDSQKADFSRMFSGGKFFIGFVKHKTYLSVDENGTEAAAATAVGMTRMAIIVPKDPFTLIVNRPFVFAIRNAESGMILFVGAIADLR